MKRDDIKAGVIAGTIFVIGCTVGLFGYRKMNEPLYAQTPVEESDQSFSDSTGIDDSDLIRIQQDISEYEPVTNENDEVTTEPTDVPPAMMDSDAIDRLSDNMQFSIDTPDTPDDRDNGEYYFDKYNNEEQQNTTDLYVLNTSTMKIHHPNCTDVKKISPENYATSSETIDELVSQGYSLCGHCF